MLSLIGLILAIVGGINAAWVLLFYILNASARLGANISQKVGTDNDQTQTHIEESKNFSGELKEKLLIRLAVTAIGLLLHYFAA